MLTTQTISIFSSALDLIDRTLSTILGYDYIEDLRVSSIEEDGIRVTFSNGHAIVSEIVTYFDLSNVLIDKEIDELEINEPF